MFGAKLKDLRKEKNLRQQDLAAIISTTQSTIVKYEQEQLEPNINALIKLADYFDCSIDYLLGRETETGIITINKTLSLKEQEQNLLYIFRELTTRRQAMALGYIAGLLDEQRKNA